MTNKKDSMDDNNNFISDYYYVTVKLNVNKDINDRDVPLRWRNKYVPDNVVYRKDR